MTSGRSSKLQRLHLPCYRRVGYCTLQGCAVIGRVLQHMQRVRPLVRVNDYLHALAGKCLVLLTDFDVAHYMHIVLLISRLSFY